MRILFTIPHFFNPSLGGSHSSQRAVPQQRLQAIAACIHALHQLFSKSQCLIQVGQRLAVAANRPQGHDIKVVICTTQNHHLLEQLPVLSHLYEHHPTQAEPMLLGFEAHTVLKAGLGRYDYYCFLEDDLILHDPWFFSKLSWFTSQVGAMSLLQPNRYEVAERDLVSKAYVDGDLNPWVTEPYQDIQQQSEISGMVLGTPVTFRRALNPHSGCFFLNAEQMESWVQQPYFLDRETRFVGPLESAATLGIMRAFRIYKPTADCASFLEIQHAGRQFLSLIGNQVRMAL
ncbi:hypothetical protein DO97_08465 [Neosynechococcus sphagnicola sy1]|uniref:Calcium-binding protein n=1 Tax=Neosynechococcus sphagnicola sy1 TaxID=1497020 RepID=A0A098TIM4_9CYAN|nr:hypothetical protein [Neosynechococcus sphagnicola]KGF72415.1 hypothetical protein DO97_08465 [Neosynechococcus sphagnicola sy1]